MKRVLILAGALAVSSMIAAAAPCSDYTPGGNVNLINAAGGCTVTTPNGDLTFNNFTVLSAGYNGSVSPIPSPVVNLISATNGNPAVMSFNPNLTPNTFFDIHLQFSVTGAAGVLINTISMDGGSATGQIQENVCTAAQNINNGACGASDLGTLTWLEGEGNNSLAITPTQTIWIYKNIFIDPNDPTSHNSGFSQGFTTESVAAIPEPMTFSMVGLGLLGLGILGRRRLARK
jgi:hypothetical protein